MKINHIIIIVLLGLVPLTSASAAPIEQTLKFTTTIPAEDFEIEPRKPWPTNGEVTTLNYDNATGRFEPYENTLKILSTVQDVTAKLQSAAELSNGREKMKAIVLIMNQNIGVKEVTTSAQRIHTKAADPAHYSLQVVQGTKNPTAGTYTGDIVLIFEGA